MLAGELERVCKTAPFAGHEASGRTISAHEENRRNADKAVKRRQVVDFDGLKTSLETSPVERSSA